MDVMYTGNETYSNFQSKSRTKALFKSAHVMQIIATHQLPLQVDCNLLDYYY